MSQVILGVLLSKVLVVKKDKTFNKFVVGIQTGYNMELKDLYQFQRVSGDENKLVIGSDVSAIVNVTAKDYPVVESIEEKILFYCKKCQLNASIDDVDHTLCEGCLMPERERLSGRWSVTDRSEFTLKQSKSTAVKLFLEQDENKLCLVAFPGGPFYETMSDIAIGAIAAIDGWRDDNRHSIIWNFTKCLKDLKRKRV